MVKVKKNAALRDLKSRLNGASNVFYVAGLSGYSRPTSEQRTSQGNTSLHPSNNLSITREMNDSNKNGQYHQ